MQHHRRSHARAHSRTKGFVTDAHIRRGIANGSKPRGAMSMRVPALMVLLTMVSFLARAEGVYQQPRSFIDEVFAQHPPTVGALWLTEDLKAPVRKIMGHDLNTLRLPRIIAIIDPGNLASVRVAEKIGMRFEREIMFDGYTHPDHLYAVLRSP